MQYPQLLRTLLRCIPGNNEVKNAVHERLTMQEPELCSDRTFNSCQNGTIGSCMCSG